MNDSRRDEDATQSFALHAYHDGELSRLARWRFERRLRRSPELRRDLETLREVGRAVCEHDAAVSTPDLWDAIALRLPAADAVRGEARDAEPARWLPGWRSLSTAVAAAAVALALAIGVDTGDTATAGGVIQWMDSGDRAVMVLEGDEDVTIIWVLDDPVEGASRGGFSGAA